MVDNGEIAQLFDADGTFVSAYPESPSDEPNAAYHLTTRWKTMRAELARAGADDAMVEAMDEAVGVDTAAVHPEPRAEADNEPDVEVDTAADHRGGDVVAIIAADGEVLHRKHLPQIEGAGRGRVGAVPWVIPLIEADATHLPFVVVLADRAGADIHGYGHDREVAEVVEGTESDIVRNAPGGLSQRRYQQRAIDSWERNATEVAADAARLADELDAELILIGGDDHVVSYFRDALPHPWPEHTHRLTHATRAAGGKTGLITEEITRAVATALAEQQVEALRHHRDNLGQDERAAEGVDAVITALQAARVDTLLVHDDLDDERTAWFGPEPNHLGIDRADLEAMGVTEPKEGRLVDVAVRAAMGTGATVQLVPAATVDDGLGAILRA